MSGEITLRGRVLPVGGVREKVLAAYRLKMATVILPELNSRDLADVPSKARASLQFRFVKGMDEVLEAALLPRRPKPKRRVKTTRTRTTTRKSTPPPTVPTP
jgi:ATP-dependent Lon protease